MAYMLGIGGDMMPEATGEDDVTMSVKCPKCGYEWDETQTCKVTVTFEWSDYAPDYP